MNNEEVRTATVRIKEPGKKMRDNVRQANKKAREACKKFWKAKDPKERERLQEELAKSNQEAMDAIAELTRRYRNGL